MRVRIINFQITKKKWKEIYRLARCPDMFLADNISVNFPLRFLFDAMKCVEVRNARV